MTKTFRAAAFALALLGLTTAAEAARSDHPPRTTEPPLMPRTEFFGNPVKIAGSLSPDGRWLAWEAPSNGVLNVWIAPLERPADARVLTEERVRPVPGFFWSQDSRMILYAADNGGDENYQLYGVDVDTGARRALTDFKKTRVGVVAVSHDVPDRILIQANNRDPRFFDVLSLDLKTGAITTVYQNTGFVGFLADSTLTLRGARRPMPSGEQDLFRFVDDKPEATPTEIVPFEDSLATAAVGFTHDGKTLYWLDSRGRDTTALIAEDVATGAKKVLAEDPRADIAGVIRDPATGRILAYAVDYLRLEWRALDPSIQPDLDFLRAHLKGEFSLASQTHDGSKWIVYEQAGDMSGRDWLYDRKIRALTKLFEDRPELDNALLAPMRPVQIKARDGLTLVSYLTLPVGTDPKGTGRPSHPLPMVLFIHGGPWARDAYGYNGVHQWLANRGYAVLSVNFRGSTGFGKRFVAAGDLEWGGKMEDDLVDAAHWAVKQGIAAPGGVAMLGGSYGGYATLAGLALRPDEFACGVDLAGPSNLISLEQTVPPYWVSEMVQFRHRMGDPSTPQGLALLKARSPVFSAGNIRRPLLIGQGTNDPRVVQDEADQIVAAMNAHDIPVTYLLISGEGHGFARPQDNLAFFAVAEQFLGKCLGGRAEPIGDAMKQSPMQVKAGGDLIPGLMASEQ